MPQFTVWDQTDPTADAVAQQASALSALAGSAPDQLDTAAKQDTVTLCRNILQHVSASDTASIASILSTITSVAGQAAADAAALLIPTSRRRRRRLEFGTNSSFSEEEAVGVYDAEHARRLAASVETASALLDETNNAIQDIAKAVLAGVVAGENVVSIAVRGCVCTITDYCFCLLSDSFVEPVFLRRAE